MWMNVIIYHNNESDFFTPYSESQSVAPVFIYAADVDGTMAQPEQEAARREAERAYMIGQNGVPQIGDEATALNARYGAGRNRSVSVSDLVQVGVYVFAADLVGMRRTGGKLNVQPNQHDNF